MARIRISTTVDAELLEDAGRIHADSTDAKLTDAKLLDAALTALVAQTRIAKIEAAYETAYSEQPLEIADEWGDLDSFRRGAASS